jgi:enolase
MIVDAIKAPGYSPGHNGIAIAIALDPAASEFRQDDGTYRVAGQTHSSNDMIARYEQMITDFPIWSIEDGLGEDDTPAGSN